MDDASSISSYETTREMFDEESGTETEAPGSLPPPVPPNNEKPKIHIDGSDVSRASDSTASTAAAPPIRRKSVRMSLPPTFSTTPPAFDDDDDEARARHRPWSDDSQSHARAHTHSGTGWSSRIMIEENGAARDFWADSSDEDEDYKKARRLLSRLSKKTAR